MATPRRNVITGRPPKLSPAELVEARSRFKSGESKASLARRFNVADKTLAHYLRGGHKNPGLTAVTAYAL
jgi:hypothetical protein